MRLRTVSILFVMNLLIVSSMAFQWGRPTSVLAQSSSRKAPPIEWSKTYGDANSQEACSVRQTTDGGFILVGTSGLSAWLVKTDGNGDMLWNRTHGKVGYEIVINAGQQTVDGGYMVAGGIRAAPAGKGDAFLLKTDENGNPEWNRTYGASGHERALSAQQTDDGGYIWAGGSIPDNVNNYDFFLMKTDASGNTVWNKTFGVASANEFTHSVKQTSDGGYILAGESTDIGMGDSEPWVVRTDTNGNMIWNATIWSSIGSDWINSVQQTSDGGYIMAGYRDARVGDLGDFWLVKTDAYGSVQWRQAYDDGNPSTNDGGPAKSVYETDDGGYIAVGEYFEGWAMNARADVWVVKTDSYGNMIWKIKYGGYEGYDSALSVIQTNDGGYAVAGYSWIYMLFMKIMRANPPMATFIYSPINASVQQRILFNASASYDLDEDIVSYVWDFDDDNVTTVSSPIISHRYESPRTYNVTLTITDGEELNSSLSKEVWVRVATYIEMSVIDWAYIGFEIGVSGRLYDIFGHYLKNENVTLQWYIGGNTWTLLGWDMTNEYGDYAIVWNPPTVTSYMLKVRWSGNQTFHAAENTKTTSIRSIPTRISLGLWSSTSLIGFQVAVGGDLTSDLGAVSNAPVLLSYSVTRGQTWNEITQATTDSDGHYSAVWMPTATGNYLVKAVWTGNSTYPTASKAVSLTVLPFEERNVFSVISNSTVSELSFESTHKELSFIVEGPAGTAGYVDVYVANTLIADIEGVEVKLNGTEIEYTASPSLGDSWLIHFTYQHSIHSVEVNLGFETEVVDGRLPYLLYFIVGAAVIALIVGVAVMKKRRTGLKGKA